MNTATDPTPTPVPPPAPPPPAPRPPPVAQPPFTGREDLGNVARYAAERLNAQDRNPDGSPRWRASYAAVERVVPTPGTSAMHAFTVTVKRTEADGVAYMLVLPAQALAVSGFPAPSDVRLKVKADGTANWARLVEASTLFITRREEARIRRGHEKARGARVQALRESALALALADLPAWGSAEGWTPTGWAAGSQYATFRWNTHSPHPLLRVNLQAARVTTVALSDTRSDVEIAQAMQVTVGVGNVDRCVTLREGRRLVAAMLAAAAHFNATAVEP